jgi:hypothetical protein
MTPVTIPGMEPPDATWRDCALALALAAGVDAEALLNGAPFEVINAAGERLHAGLRFRIVAPDRPADPRYRVVCGDAVIAEVSGGDVVVPRVNDMVVCPDRAPLRVTRVEHAIDGLGNACTTAYTHDPRSVRVHMLDPD